MTLQPKKSSVYRDGGYWLRLKQLGYDVIWANGKTGPGFGWPTRANTPADIAAWKGTTAGVRTAGQPTLFIDLDVHIASAMAELLAEMTARWPDFMAACLRRHSGKVSLCLIGLCPDTDRRVLRTRSFKVNLDDADEKKQRAEIYTGNVSHYFAVHGLHSSPPDRHYDYHGRSILDVPLRELPIFPAADLGKLIDLCEAVLERPQHGLTALLGTRTEGLAAEVFDLTPEQVFKLKEGDTITLAELSELVRTAGKHEGFATIWDVSSESPDRVKANWHGLYGLQLFDTHLDVKHYLIGAEPQKPDMEKLAEGLKAAGRAAGVELPREVPNWRERNAGGGVRPSLHNARLAILAGGLCASEDTFHGRLWLGRGAAASPSEPLLPFLGEITDAAVLALREWLSDIWGIDFGEKHVRDAVLALAYACRFDPVVDMLAEAQASWDGKARLDRVAAEHFNAPDTELNSRCVRKTLIAAVARARTPGCKYDTMLVLEGREGFNKSSAWAVLAGEGNFSDARIIGADAREVQEQLASCWIHENADLAGMRKAEVEVVKTFASRTEDRARPAYGRLLVSQPRHSIEVGTTNNDRYLQSQTGNRRFWPMLVERAIDLERLRSVRLQLWGEAAHWQAQGESLVLDERLWAAAAIEQEARRVQHPWEEFLANLLGINSDAVKAIMGEAGAAGIVRQVGGHDVVATTDLFTALRLPAIHQTSNAGRDLANCMRAIGWEAHKYRHDGIERRGYRRCDG